MDIVILNVPLDMLIYAYIDKASNIKKAFKIDYVMAYLGDREYEGYFLFCIRIGIMVENCARRISL